MSEDILIKGGNISIPSDKPWEIRFDSADDIILPFRGTVVIPANPTTELDFARIGIYESMFISFKYPLAVEGEATQRKFPFLRDYKNQSIITSRPTLILVADDYSYLDNLNFGQLFQDISEFYEPQFVENITISSIPRYLLIEFDSALFTGDTQLPENARPVSRNKELKLKVNTETESGLVELRTILSSLSTLSGNIRAFDQAGRQTEAYSALRALGVDKTISDQPAIDGSTIKVQFVDLHGNVLNLDTFPLSHLNITPALGGESDFEIRQFYTLNFSGAERKLNFNLKTVPGSLADGDFEYMYHLHYFCLWPGYGYKLKEIKSDSSSAKLDLIKNFDPAENTQPTFVRICIFHPQLDFQSTIGGDIKFTEYNDFDLKKHKKVVFQDNKIQFFSSENKVKIFNSGDQFFKHLYKLVKKLKTDDEYYQINWSSNPLLHLNGSMALRAITHTDTDSTTIRQQIESLRTQSIIVNIISTNKFAVWLPNRINAGAVFTNDFSVEIKPAPSIGVFEKVVHKGFVRSNTVCAWKLKVVDPDLPIRSAGQHHVLAYWKNSMGNVIDTQLDELLVTPSQEVVSINNIFPDAAFSLETDESDPPQLQIRRLDTITNITASPGLSTATGALQLIVINLASGGFYLLPIEPPGSDPTSSDVILTIASDYPEPDSQRTAIEELISTFSAGDKLLFSIGQLTTSVDSLLTEMLLTDFTEKQFSNDDIRTANIPLNNQELGGLLRSSIQKGVKVKGLYWEQYLATLTGSSSAQKGLSTNESIVNIINRSIDGSRGHAFRDRSTRDFGSWHQKATIIFKDNPSDDLFPPPASKSVICYIGGLDLTTGRWDTPLHFNKDPDRQGNPWFDVHVYINGDAAIDVMQSFKHRWKAMEAFLTPGMDDCRPVNASTELANSVSLPFRMPNPVEERIKAPKKGNAFIQINRTIPPLSCFANPAVIATTGVSISNEDGELAALESYKYATSNAKRFIFINDQYFFSLEMALLLHERLKAVDGPDFLVLAVPKNLNESKYIDPHLFQIRKMAIQVLKYGATDSSGGSGPRCGQIIPLTSSTADTDVSNKVAVMIATNQEGKDIYIHSKHYIVDDVWMSIGSANTNNRSLTFDMEMNAAIMGKKLFKGGTDIVRNQRISICRQLLGLPNAYSALLQDPYATFRLFKAIEGQEESNSFRLHPQPLMTKWLNVDYKKRTGNAAFDNEVDIVASLDLNDASFNFLTCNLLDPDGRSPDSNRLAVLTALGGIGKTAPSATANLSFTYDALCDSEIRTRISAATAVKIYIQVSITTNEEGSFITKGPFDIENYLLDISIETSAIILTGNLSGVVTIPLSTLNTIIAHVYVKDESSDTIICTAEQVFNPSTSVPAITYGSFRNVVLTLEAP